MKLCFQMHYHVSASLAWTITPCSYLLIWIKMRLSLKKIEKRAFVRNCFLTKYAKLLCKKFWNTFDQRCLDVKNNRSFIRLSSKEQIKSLFDELHASVTDKEFEEMVGCPMGKEIFVTCTKTRVKLINLVIKLVDN